MIKTINFDEFARGFSGSYQNNFTGTGLEALFEYLEQQEQDTGEQIEFDPIALCCEWAEYSSADEAGREFFTYESMTYGKDGEELETVDEVEAKAIKYFEDEGITYIKLDNGGVIIQK